MLSKETSDIALRLAVAAIHITPAIGALGPDALRRLYGISFDDPTTQLLMRHRAVLFGLLGSFLAASAFRGELRPVADVAAIVSVTSFLALEKMGPEHKNQKIGSVVRADWIALACQIGAMMLSRAV